MSAISTDRVRVFMFIKRKEGVTLEDLKKYMLEVYPKKVMEHPSSKHSLSLELIFTNTEIFSQLPKAPQEAPIDLVIQTDLPSYDSFLDLFKDEAFLKETEEKIKELADVTKTMVLPGDIAKIL